jgi:hypothetical protein
MVVREVGLVGEGSREPNGDGAADDEVEAAEVWDANLDWPWSTAGWVIVAVLDEDWREYAGRPAAGSDGPADVVEDLSMSTCDDQV